MKKICLVIAVLCMGSYAHAYNMSQYYSEMKALDVKKAQMEAKLGLSLQVDSYQHATSYYDDWVDHYEQGQMMLDVIE